MYTIIRTIQYNTYNTYRYDTFDNELDAYKQYIEWLKVERVHVFLIKGEVLAETDNR